MTTHTVTHHPALPDGPQPTGAPGAPPRHSTRWALAGVGAGLTGGAATISSAMVDAVYDPALGGDVSAISDKLAGQVPQMLAFHILGVLSAILMIVFAAGLYRRLRATAPESSTAPLVAFAGLLGTAVVLIIGTGLDTEFIFAVGQETMASQDNQAFYNSFIGTIPWCWVLTGLSGLALHAVARAGGIARWVGIVGLLGGALTLLLGISPQQYLAGMTGPLGLTIVAVGFLLGDKAYRRA